MLTIDGKEHEAEPLFVPVRLELRDHFMHAEGDHGRLLLVSAASLALSHPTVLGRPKVDQRRELRADLVAYGEDALHALVITPLIIWSFELKAAGKFHEILGHPLPFSLDITFSKLLIILIQQNHGGICLKEPETPGLSTDL